MAMLGHFNQGGGGGMFGGSPTGPGAAAPPGMNMAMLGMFR